MPDLNLDELDRLARAMQDEAPGPWEWQLEDESAIALVSLSDPYGEMRPVLHSERCEACVERGNTCMWPSKTAQGYFEQLTPETLLVLIAAAREGERVREVLRRVDTHRYFSGDLEKCAICGKTKFERHASDCELALALKGGEG
jgi:hypothetical protein